MMRRGYSLDQRPDEINRFRDERNHDGFLYIYERSDRNSAVVSTVEAIQRTVERKHGKAR